jgi:hypothetical protein
MCNTLGPPGSQGTERVSEGGLMQQRVLSRVALGTAALAVLGLYAWQVSHAAVGAAPPPDWITTLVVMGGVFLVPGAVGFAAQLALGARNLTSPMMWAAALVIGLCIQLWAHSFSGPSAFAAGLLVLWVMERFVDAGARAAIEFRSQLARPAHSVA